MRIKLDNLDKVATKPDRLRDLHQLMMQLSVAERRQRWKDYLAQVTSLNQDSASADRAVRCRAFFEDARREAETGPLETRDDFLLLANVWKGLAKEFEEPNAREARLGLRKKASRSLPRDQR